jgi:hypothetical protein
MKRAAGFQTSLLLLLSLATFEVAAANSNAYFRIEVVDDQTGRGVPWVELSTTSGERFFTDSNGLIALDAPELIGQETWFTVASHGYEYPADGFGFRGARVTPRLGERVTLKIKRLNIAERLYRITGAGIYRDTVQLGERPPIKQPLLNAQVAGQDSALAAVYRGRLFWVWGDTAQIGYALGHFATAAATSQLPGRGGLPPAVGVDLQYITGDGGFSRGVAALGRPGLVWTDGLLAINDDAGQERLFAHYVRMKDIDTLAEWGFMVFNDEKKQFEVIRQLPLDAPLMAGSHPIRHRVNGQDYLYFPGFYPRPEAYAHVRAKADWKSLVDPAQYEGFSCLRAGARYQKENPPLEHAPDGSLVWGWKRNTPSLTRLQFRELFESGALPREQSPVRFVDVESGKPLELIGGSIAWNDFRRRWILISVNAIGDMGVGGEVYFAEADAPEGPWVHARRIATHTAADDAYDFYNPVHHPFFDEQGGRYIYFEGTLSTYFSKNHRAAPRYSYNQLMYRLDLADARLAIPTPGPN